MAYDPQKNKRRPRPSADDDSAPIDGLLGAEAADRSESDPVDVTSPDAPVAAGEGNASPEPSGDGLPKTWPLHSRVSTSTVAPSVTPGPGAPDPSAKLVAVSAASGALSAAVAFVLFRRWRTRR